jgi:RNA polymerase sigma factor (sigma-70 family)
MKEVRLEIKAKNNLILRRMERLGIESVIELARRIGFTKSGYSELVGLITMRLSPHYADGSWKPIPLRLSEFFRCLPEDLFSPEQQSAVNPKKAVLEVTFEETARYLAGRTELTPEDHLLKDEFSELFAELLEQLPPRHAEVLRRYFGFNGDPETLTWIAESLGLSTSRVQQIYARSIERLKNPMKGYDLKRIGYEVFARQA